MLGPAGNLIAIESGKDYSDDDIIFSIHCLMTNTSDVKITTITNSSFIFPAGSLVKGAVYHIYIKMIEFELGTAGFAGYQLLKNAK